MRPNPRLLARLSDPLTRDATGKVRAWSFAIAPPSAILAAENDPGLDRDRTAGEEFDARQDLRRTAPASDATALGVELRIQENARSAIEGRFDPLEIAGSAIAHHEREKDEEGRAPHHSHPPSEHGDSPERRMTDGSE